MESRAAGKDDLLPCAVGVGEWAGCVESVDGWVTEDRVEEIVRGAGRTAGGNS